MQNNSMMNDSMGNTQMMGGARTPANLHSNIYQGTPNQLSADLSPHQVNHSGMMQGPAFGHPSVRVASNERMPQ